MILKPRPQIQKSPEQMLLNITLLKVTWQPRRALRRSLSFEEGGPISFHMCLGQGAGQTQVVMLATNSARMQQWLSLLLTELCHRMTVCETLKV